MNGEGEWVKVGQLVSTVKVRLEHKLYRVVRVPLRCFASAYNTTILIILRNKVRA